MIIRTTHGDFDEELLRKVEGRREDANEIATWQEWWLGTELVKRDAQVHLKSVSALGATTRMGDQK